MPFISYYKKLMSLLKVSAIYLLSWFSQIHSFYSPLRNTLQQSASFNQPVKQQPKDALLYIEWETFFLRSIQSFAQLINFYNFLLIHPFRWFRFWWTKWNKCADSSGILASMGFSLKKEFPFRLRLAKRP